MGNLGRIAIAAALVAAAVAVWAELSAPKDATSVSISTAEKQPAKVSGSQAGSEADPARPANGAAPLSRRGPYIDAALVEGTPQGFLPRIGPRGRKPSDVYAAAAPNNNGPRLGLVIAGLGLQPALLQRILTSVRTPVSLAFSPSGSDLATATQAARDLGHETLVMLPVSDDPAGDASGSQSASKPGARSGASKVIAAGLAPLEKTSRLRWILTRFGGYVGVLSLRPAAALAIDASLTRRGLLLIAPDGAFTAGGGRIIQVRRDGLTADRVQKALDKARDAAAAGKVIVILPALPVAIDALARWTMKDTAGKPPIALAPATALLKQP